MVAEELRKTKRGGIPWSVILDEDGAPLITSDGPKGNIGCPVQPAEIEFFLVMLDKTRRHMSDDDRKVIETALRAYADELLRPRRERNAKRAYEAASVAVKSGDLSVAMKELTKALESGFSPAAAILSDRDLRRLREDPDHRLALSRLLEQHATASSIRMVDSEEAGQRIHLDGQVVSAATGEPLAGARMQLFHTDNSGEYRPGMSAGGGAGNPRIFGWLRTDANGKFSIDTIMPVRYPDSTVPRHIHYRVWAKGHPMLESECFFDSDPNLTEKTRRDAPKRGFPIVVLAKNEEGRLAGPLVVRVPGAAADK